MNTQQCKICGELKSLQEMSKSYKHRCKECVAQLSRIERKAAKQRAEHIKQQLDGTGYVVVSPKSRRAELLNIATAAMQGILSNERTMQVYADMSSNHPYPKLFDTVARNAIGYATALLDKIDEKGDNDD